MQMLSNRWIARGEFRPTTSRVALNDIERSIAAMEVSFATIEGFVNEEARQLGKTPAEVKAWEPSTRIGKRRKK